MGQGECKWAHTLDNPLLQVRLPMGLINHKKCTLPLCPVYLASMTRNGSNSKDTGAHDDDLEMSMDLIKEEHITPSKLEIPSEDPFSSSPREGIKDTFNLMSAQGHRRRRCTGASRLPKLTGVARERFKAQKKIIEEWQANQLAELDDQTLKQQKERLGQLMECQQKTQNVQNSNFGTAKNPEAETEALRSTQLRNGRTIYIFGHNSPGKEIVKEFGSTTESHREMLHEVSTTQTSLEVLAVRDEREGEAGQVEDMTGIAQYLEFREKHYTGNDVHPRTKDEYGEQQHKGNPVVISTDVGLKAKSSKVLVDYELPEGDSRLDWDTDYVRRLFGEIA